MQDVSYLLQGAVDLHVHVGPSVIPREIDAAEMMEKAAQYGYQAFVLKDHNFPTMMSADLVEKHLGKAGVKVYGGIVLNDAVGSLNIRAVDVACAMGAKIVWMPTISTENHMANEARGLKFPSSYGMRLQEKPLVYVNAQGELDSRVMDILRYLAGTDVIVATGHGSLAEVDALVHAAYAAGVKKILVNHPFYMVGAGLADMKRWAALGAYIELNATVFVPDSLLGVIPMDRAAEIIREVGPAQLVIDSDYGQKNNGCPVDGLKKFIGLLLNQYQIGEADIVRMIKDNPAALLGLACK